MSDNFDNKTNNIQQVNDNQNSKSNADSGEVTVGKGGLFYRTVKRAFDIVASFVASILLILPMAALCLAIVINDSGSPVYIQKRVGKYGKELRIFKLRTMKIGADNIEKTLTPEQLEQYKKEFKLDDDCRLIGYKKAGDGDKCFGAFLRKMSLDELPQIVFNILLKGDMSIVGPRPILKSELEAHYTPAEQQLLLSVKPGLTGYWQAYARNNATYESGERQSMELYYARNRSFLLDVKIMFATVGAVLKGQGAK